MFQPTLFGSIEDDPKPKPLHDGVVRLRLLVTVKAAPNPSERYGETVCVAGLSLDLDRPGWIRLYPINFRELGEDETFRKYDVISVDAKPARQDPRRESWRPIMATMKVENHLETWRRRRSWLDPAISESMCAVNEAVRGRPDGRSLALVRPKSVSALKIQPHPGWTDDEQTKIEAYVQQLDLLSDHARTPLEAPRFKGRYRYRCHAWKCRGHEQGLLDWEFVALQRTLRRRPDSEVREALQDRFLKTMCSPKRETAFYVGNQAKRTNVFSVLGIYYPGRQSGGRLH